MSVSEMTAPKSETKERKNGKARGTESAVFCCLPCRFGHSFAQMTYSLDHFCTYIVSALVSVCLRVYVWKCVSGMHTLLHWAICLAFASSFFWWHLQHTLHSSSIRSASDIVLLCDYIYICSCYLFCDYDYWQLFVCVYALLYRLQVACVHSVHSELFRLIFHHMKLRICTDVLVVVVNVAVSQSNGCNSNVYCRMRAMTLSNFF